MIVLLRWLVSMSEYSLMQILDLVDLDMINLIFDGA